MLTKILITALVLIIAWHFLSRKRAVKETPQTMVTGQSLLKRYGIIAFLAVILVLGLGVSVWHWYDGYQIVNVTVSSPTTGQSNTFQVRKKDIDGNLLTTIDGLQIRVSDQETITVSSH